MQPSLPFPWLSRCAAQITLGSLSDRKTRDDRNGHSSEGPPLLRHARPRFPHSHPDVRCVRRTGNNERVPPAVAESVWKDEQWLDEPLIVSGRSYAESWIVFCGA